MQRPKFVTGVFRNRADAEEAFTYLHAHGYTDSEIDVLMSDKTRALYYPANAADAERHDAGTMAPEGLGIGGAVGTAVGAALGAAVAVGTIFALPGLGLVLAGPLAGALAGGGAGAAAGGLIGLLAGAGIPEDNAAAYQEALRRGGTVIGVRPHDEAEADAIQKTFKALNAENVCYG